MAKIDVLRPFHDGPSGRLVHPGDTIEAGEQRHDDLARNGLVPPRVKAAAAPQNKMAEAPENKAIVAAQPKRRGRPPKVR